MTQNFFKRPLKIFKPFLIIIILTIVCSQSKAQFTGLIVNEFSQGTSPGSKEYIELLVVGTRTCTDSTADLRNWIVDDNNGWYGGNGTGIAQGHYKFANVTNWSKVPFGSIILLYNGDDKNTRITIADDPTDINKDYTYIVRLGSSSLILENIDVPSSPSSSNYVYPNASNTVDYSSSSNISTNIVGLANSGDAIIIVNSTDRTKPVFSITYSLATTPKTPTVKLGALGSGENAYLSNANYNVLSSWVVGSAGTSDETPGLPNTTANATWINSMRVQLIGTPSVSTTTGTNSICIGTTTKLSNTTPSGVWSSDNTVVASVNSTGLVSGISAGTANIIYTVTNACGTATNPFLMTIAPLPSVPTITTVDPTCVASGSITVTSPAGSGFTYSKDGTSFQTSPAFTTGIGAGNYAITVKNSSGCANTASATLNPAPSAPATPLFTVTQPTCTVATGSITVTAVSGITYNIGSNNFNTTTTINNLVPNSYIITATNSGGCITTTTAVVNTQPAPPSAPIVTSPVTYCQNGIAAALTATGTNLLWYGTAATGGTASGTAPIPITTTGGSANYYVSQTVGSCESPRAAIVVSVTATPAAPTVTTPVTYCQNGIASALTATGTNLLWYGTSATGGTISTTAPTPITTASGNTTYYVSQTVSSCESPRVAIVVSVTATPAAPTVSTPVVYCQNATAAALTATGTNLLWYGTAATGGTSSITAPTPITTASGNTSYYVSQTVSSCESPRAVIVVSITATPVAPTVTTPVIYCQNTTAAALTATGTNLLWYGTAATGGTSSATAPTPITTASGNTSYYVSQTVSSCESPRAAIVVSITAAPSAPTVTTPVSYCQNATAAGLTAIGTNLLWYGTAATGGTASGTAPIPITTTGGSANYYVSQTVGICESPRAVIVVSITATPIAPTVTTPVIYCQNTTAAALTAIGTNLLWYGTAATGGTSSSIAPIPPTTTTGTTNYYVSQTVSGCESPRANIAVVIETFTINLSANPNPAFGGVPFTGQITANLPIASSIWQPSNLFVNNLSTQTIVAPDTSFTLVVTGLSANGCRSTVSRLITVMPSNNTIFIPNALTPAAVGTDASVIKVYGTTVKTAQLLVYNQWGQLIFQTDSATTRGWDGTFNGKAQPSGVYNYVVRIMFQNNKVETKSGSINLIR